MFTQNLVHYYHIISRSTISLPYLSFCFHLLVHIPITYFSHPTITNDTCFLFCKQDWKKCTPKCQKWNVTKIHSHYSNLVAITTSNIEFFLYPKNRKILKKNFLMGVFLLSTNLSAQKHQLQWQLFRFFCPSFLTFHPFLFNVFITWTLCSQHCFMDHCFRASSFFVISPQQPLPLYIVTFFLFPFGTSPHFFPLPCCQLLDTRFCKLHFRFF